MGYASGMLPQSGSPRFPDAVHHRRLAAAAAAAGERAIDALLITPSPDFAYLLGYRPPALERLTCLIVPVEGQPTLVVPRLEEPLAEHELDGLADDVEVRAWDETDDPFRLVRALVNGARRAAVQDQMWARFVLRLRATLDPVELVAAGATMSALRRVKSPEEVDRLRAAAAAADEAMLAVTGEHLSGRTEREVSARVRELLLQAGHETADAAIVASGPNAASPHHEAGDRTIGSGDSIVFDIGGTRAGYASDTSRTAFVGEAPDEFRELYAVLQEAQAAACEAVAPGVAAEEIDAVARYVLSQAGEGG